MALGNLGAMASSSSQTELTVYSEGLGLVKERRSLFLRVGEQSVSIEDLAEHIDANTVGIRSLSKPHSFSVLEQTFRYDQMRPELVLERSIGRKAVLSRVVSEKTRERTTGTVLSAPTHVSQGGNDGPTWNGMIFKTDDGRFIMSPTGQIEIPQLPRHFYYKPTLVWEVSSSYSGENVVELSYVTGGLQWRAGYVLWVDEAGTQGELKAWVTVDNHCGHHFNEARLTLVNGSPHKQNKPGTGDAATQELGLKDVEVPEAQIYELQRPVTLRHGENKQLMYMESQPFEIEKKLVMDTLAKFKGRRPSSRAYGVGKSKPLVLYTFANEPTNDLGMPLPPGNVQVFQRTSGGATRILGEDSLEHTNVHGVITLIAGHSLTVSSDRRRTHYEVVETDEGSGCVEKFKITLENSGEHSETVHIVERNWTAGNITDCNVPLVHIDAQAVLFVVEVPAKGQHVIEYTLTSQW